MTFDEFRDIATEGLAVRCHTTQQRRDIIQLFDDCGFFIGDETRRHLDNTNDNDTTYMHPSYIPSRGYVTCYRDFETAIIYVKHGVDYEEVRSLIENSSPIDDRSDAEFARDFALLLC